jgi:hypothetical protein
VLVADSDVSTPANAAAAITALMNFNITAPRSFYTSCPQVGDQKSSVTNPQSATPTSRGFIANSLSSLTTLLAVRAPNSLATIGGNGCSTQVTDC